MTADSSAQPGFTQDAGIRLAEQVQDLGFRSARSVIGRFGQLFEEFYTGMGSPTEINPLDWLRPRLDRLSQGETAPLCLPDTAPGALARSSMWLHNPTSAEARSLSLWTPGLVAHDGRAIPTSAVAFDPPAVDLIDADSSIVIAVNVAVPNDATGGCYHGLVMIHGLAECAFPLTLKVIHPGAR